MKSDTKVNHATQDTLPGDNHPLVPPLHRSVKYTFPSLEETERAFRSEREGFFYARYGNPTTRQLETLLAELQHREGALATSSGMSAIATCLFSLLRQGDHILMFIESYRPSRYFVRNMLGRFGVTHSLLSIHDHDAIAEAAKREETRVILFESPTNPITRIADIEFITRTARENRLLTILDNTFAGFHNHGQYPIDIYLHSLTKFASGHGDAMGGGNHRLQENHPTDGKRFWQPRVRYRPLVGLADPPWDENLSAALSHALRQCLRHRAIPRGPRADPTCLLSGARLAP